MAMTVVETSFSNEQRRQPRVQINHVSKYHREGGITCLKAKEWLVVLLRDVHLEANSNLKYIWNVFQLYERTWWPQNGWVLSLNSFEFRTFNSTKKHENFAKLRQWFFFSFVVDCVKRSQVFRNYTIQEAFLETLLYNLA